MTDTPSIFKTTEFEKQYMDLYDIVLGQWKVPAEAMDVSTPFGTTHINACGSPGKPALLLLPGFGANSTMWFPNIAALSRQFRVYAVDTNGQASRSIPTQELRADNSADWISQLLDRLGLEKANFAGISLGGWLALNYAIQEPERTERVVLLDPAASFAKMSPVWLLHSVIPFMVHPTRAGLIKYFRWMNRGYVVDRNWGELMLQGILNTRPQPPIRAVPFSDSDLASIQVPVLVLIGGRSVIYNPQRALRQATRWVPGVRAEIIPDASHALIAEKADVVNARILEFFQR